MASPIGQVLHRKPERGDARDRVKVVGAVNSGYVCETADSFGTPFFVAATELATAYGADLASLESEDEYLRRIDQEANEVAARARFRRVTTEPTPDPASPEGQFAALAAAEAEAQDDA